jgi:hypothetical protein
MAGEMTDWKRQARLSQELNMFLANVECSFVSYKQELFKFCIIIVNCSVVIIHTLIRLRNLFGYNQLKKCCTFDTNTVDNLLFISITRLKWWGGTLWQ